MQYAAYERTFGLPNVIVDGEPNKETVLHLSHEIGSLTPQNLKADLSSQIVFNFLRQDGDCQKCELASSNVFDTDTLVGLYSLLNGKEAFRLEPELLALARAGTFEEGTDEDVVRASFVIAAWQNPRLSPLNQTVFERDPLQITNILYEELLPRLPKIIERVHYLEQYWISQDQALEETEKSFENKKIVITEFGDLDLAIVEAEAESKTGIAGGEGEKTRLYALNLHPIAIHNRTKSSRIMILNGDLCSFYYRPESGVCLTSRSTAARIDLGEVAKQFNAMEAEPNAWRFGSLRSAKPHLEFTGEGPSRVTKNAFKKTLIELLSQSPFASRSEPGERG